MQETKKQKAELLSPAGSLTTLKAVAQAGADAVYAAGGSFGARAHADNFTEEELLYAIDYLHLHEKKLYLTVNTLLKEEELERQLYDYIRPLYRQGLDGVIIQDLGVLTFLRQHFPGMELHASTQMSITGPNGARLMKELGCSRIVTARELSLKEIKKIHDEVDIEIESFIHGALCYCYSGQCLMSSLIGGRSGNRGRCAQPCRLPYHVDEPRMPKDMSPADSIRDRAGFSKGSGSVQIYPLSPKDLCTIDLLPQLLENGVYSLKIEGRMKQAEYAAGVTSIYREYLDRYLADGAEGYQVSPEDRKRLEELGSRSGFTQGYYVQKNGPEMMAMEKPAHTKGSEQLWRETGERFLNCEIQEKMNGILKLSKENPAVLVLQYKGEAVTVTGDLVQKAKSRPMEQSVIEEKMRKTGGSGFAFETLRIEMEDDIFIPVGALNQLRRDGIAALAEKLLEKCRRQEKEQSVGTMRVAADNDTKQKSDVGSEANQSSNVSSPYLAVSVQTKEQFAAVLRYPYVDRIYVDSGAFEAETKALHLRQMAAEAHNAGKALFYSMPAVVRGATSARYEAHGAELIESGIDGFVAGNYEALALARNMIDKCGVQRMALLADSSLYAWTDRAAEALLAAGADAYTLPVEANEREMQRRGRQDGELLIYGYLPLMVSAQCVVKNTEGCRQKTGFTILTDRYGKRFSVKNNCRDCYNIIYNTSPLSLLHQREKIEKLKTSGLRISFTREREKEIARIMSYYEQSFLRKEAIDKSRYLKDFTNGHFTRGVE